ncbi:pogo transposable element with KRAB domain [Trichonephila clavipes]|nr:pogo transposable element with KRAB domain [Trichonephila clavipes]
MDEVPLSFDIPPTRTVDVQGASSIPINTTGNERTSFTVVLCCAANGLKLPPMLIFKRKTPPKENFPKCVEIHANENGWMNEQIMLSWLQTIWRKRKNSFFRPKAFLIMDSMKSHVSENVKNALKFASAKIALIPGGLTKKLQPLDVGINRPFKSKCLVTNKGRSSQVVKVSTNTLLRALECICPMHCNFSTESLPFIVMNMLSDERKSILGPFSATTQESTHMNRMQPLETELPIGCFPEDPLFAPRSLQHTKCVYYQAGNTKV